MRSLQLSKVVSPVDHPDGPDTVGEDSMQSSDAETEV